MVEAKGKRHRDIEIGSEAQVIEDSPKAKSGAVWIRADRAICAEDECITIKSSKGGELELRLCCDWANHSECPGSQDGCQGQPDNYGSSMMKHGKEQTCESGNFIPELDKLA